MFRYKHLSPALVLCAIFASHTHADASSQDDTTAKLAESYGIDHWQQIEAIRFTYNDIRGDHAVSRQWEWRPQSNTVKLTFTDDTDTTTTIEYDRDDITDHTSEQLRQAERWFINDSFRLLLPLYIIHHEGTRVEAGKVKLAPLGRIVAREITVTFPERNDVCKLYVDDAWRVHQWTFDPGKDEDNRFTSIWLQDVQLGPLTLNSTYLDPKTRFKLEYTDLALKLIGEDGWHTAKQIKHSCRSCP